MKLSEADQFLKDQLKDIYEQQEAGNIAALVLEEFTAFNRPEQLLRKEEMLAPEAVEQIREVAKRLRAHEPIQYIMNKTWFYGMELYVNRQVLVPRPETEELVDWIIRDAKKTGLDVFQKNAGQADETRTLKIMDVCTGSGCIALALKKNMPRAEVWGCDVSEEALNVARRNGSSLDIRVDFQGLDFLDPAQQRQLPSVDIIASNPPYVPAKDQETMQPNVLLYEPRIALFVPDNDPLVFYRALVAFSGHRLHQGGSIYVEIHEALGNEVSHLFRQAGFTEVEIKKDMQGKDRMVKGMKP